MENQNKKSFNCSHCYLQPGNFLLPCYCLLCTKCLKNLIQNKTEKCTTCNIEINMKKIVDLNQKDQFLKYSFIFSDPEKLFKQAIESYKFQNRYNMKYIDYLKKSNKNNLFEKPLTNYSTNKLDSVTNKGNDINGTMVKLVSPSKNNSSIKQKKISISNLNNKTGSILNTALNNKLNNYGDTNVEFKKIIEIDSSDNKTSNNKFILKTPNIINRNLGNYYKNK